MGRGRLERRRKRSVDGFDLTRKSPGDRFWRRFATSDIVEGAIEVAVADYVPDIVEVDGVLGTDAFRHLEARALE